MKKPKKIAVAAEKKMKFDVQKWAEMSKEKIKIEALEERLGEAEEERDALLTLLDREQKKVKLALAISDPVDPPIIHPSKKRRDSIFQGAALALASDWHVEERVDPKTVNAVNEYNPQIARARAESFFKGLVWNVNVLRGGDQRYQIDDLVLWLGGDMITGYIHEELQESNFLSPVKAILFCQELISSGINYLLKETGVPRITIVCNYGNHGRTTEKRRIATSADNSFEWLMYHTLAKQYVGNSRVKFHIANGSHVYLEVMDHTVRFHHGDEIKYNGGIGGITIPFRKAVDAWNRTRHADVTVIGHYHQWMGDNADLVVNGSLIGYNAYAQSIKASFEPPRQGFFVLDPDRGKRFVSPVLVAPKVAIGKNFSRGA